jgi:hypothetical protein
MRFHGLVIAPADEQAAGPATAPAPGAGAAEEEADGRSVE